MIWDRYSYADDTAVWLARSCAGEAGFDSYKTGECGAILHVYRKRADARGVTIVEMAKKYSAAIKKHAMGRKWVRNLRRDGEQPEHWPAAKWRYYRHQWVTLLIYVELFLNGMVPDPTPKAIHFGATFDTPPTGAKRIKTRFRNVFYR